MRPVQAFLSTHIAKKIYHLSKNGNYLCFEMELQCLDQTVKKCLKVQLSKLKLTNF